MDMDHCMNRLYNELSIKPILNAEDNRFAGIPFVESKEIEFPTQLPNTFGDNPKHLIIRVLHGSSKSQYFFSIIRGLINSVQYFIPTDVDVWFDYQKKSTFSFTRFETALTEAFGGLETKIDMDNKLLYIRLPSDSNEELRQNQKELQKSIESKEFELRQQIYLQIVNKMVELTLDFKNFVKNYADDEEIDEIQKYFIDNIESFIIDTKNNDATQLVIRKDHNIEAWELSEEWFKAVYSYLKDKKYNLHGNIHIDYK